MQLLEIVIRKISERAVLFEYSNISFGSTCFRSKCAFCSPYQLGTVLEASTVLLIENVVEINNQVWISLSSLLDQIALFVSTSKDWSTAMEDHLWVNMSVLVFFFLFIWVEFENYHSGVFFFISLVFLNTEMFLSTVELHCTTCFTKQTSKSGMSCVWELILKGNGLCIQEERVEKWTRRVRMWDRKEI